MDLFDLSDIPLPPSNKSESTAPPPLKEAYSGIQSKQVQQLKTVKNAFQIAKAKNLSFSLKKVEKSTDVNITTTFEIKAEIKEKKALPEPKVPVIEIPLVAPGQQPTRKRKSRWESGAPALITSILPPLASPSLLPQPLTTLSQWKPVPPMNNTSVIPPIAAAKVAEVMNRIKKAKDQYDQMSEEQKLQFEESRKMQALCSYILAKAKMNQIYEETGKVKYEYDSDEDTTDGTWEHKKRRAEMEKTKEVAQLLTEMGQDKHHVGDFLPPEELEHFMETYQMLREAELAGHPEAFDESYGDVQSITTPLIGPDGNQNLEKNINISIQSNGINSNHSTDISQDIATPNDGPHINNNNNNNDDKNEFDNNSNTNSKYTNVPPPSILNENISKDIPELGEKTEQPQNQPENSESGQNKTFLSVIGAGLKKLSKTSLLKNKKSSSDYQDSKLSFDNNIGYRILMKMGWDEEHGLGAKKQGITEPINKAALLPDRLGLGTLSSRGGNSANLQMGDDEFDAYRKRMMLSYRFRPNPLNNPRRPYY